MVIDSEQVAKKATAWLRAKVRTYVRSKTCYYSKYNESANV